MALYAVLIHFLENICEHIYANYLLSQAIPSIMVCGEQLPPFRILFLRNLTFAPDIFK